MVDPSTPDAAVPAADAAPPAVPEIAVPAEAMAEDGATGAAEPAAPAVRRPARARHRVALALILAFHAGLAFWMAALRGSYDIYFYDEKFNLENVVAIVQNHRLEPANGWYSLLSYLPQALVGVAMEELHQSTGKPWLQAIDPQGQPPLVATYNLALAARLVGIVYGCLTLWLVFRLGMRLFSPAAGLLASAALAVSPWMIRTSVEFKPDSLLLLATVLTLLLLARFLEQPTLKSYLWVGAGLGLCASAKLNGTFIGPLVALAGIAGALLAEPRGLKEAGKRLLIWGSAAAALAAAVFFATTPYFGLMLSYTQRIENFYGQMAGKSTPQDVIRQALADLPTSVFVGPVIAALALFGGLVALARLFERGAPSGLKLARLLPLAFALTYAVVLAFTMRYYKHNNLVQLLPSLALLAAGALAALGAFAAKLPPWFGRSVAALATLAFLGHSAWLALYFSYDENVPYDWQVLNGQLHTHARLDAPKVIVYEGPYETIPSYSWGRQQDEAALKPSVRWVDDAMQLERERLDLADVVVLRKDLGGPQRSGFFAALREAVAPEAVLEIDPHPLKVRGNGYVSIFHSWRFRDDAVEPMPCRGTEDKTVFACRLPDDFRSGEVAAVHFGFWSKKIGVAEILVGGEDGETVEPMASADLGSGKGWEAMSERFVVPYPGAPVQLRFEKPIEGRLEDAVPVTLSRWLPPEGARLEIPPPFGKRLTAPVPAPAAEPLLPAVPDPLLPAVAEPVAPPLEPAPVVVEQAAPPAVELAALPESD